MSKKLMVSGGARGADMAWDAAAQAHGYVPLHFSFPGHRTTAEAANVVELSDNELRASNKRCALAAPKLKRSWPPKSAFTRKLLQRNWYQVQRSPALYAVSHFENGIVAGGTAWAVQMFLDQRILGRPQPCYVFDQRTSEWFQADGHGGWTRLEGKPPIPPDKFTGIGSRELNPIGSAAIRAVFEEQ